MDLALLQFLSDKEVYETSIDQVDFSSLDKEAKLILKAYGHYFQKFDKEQIDFEDFPDYFLTVLHPGLGNSQVKILNTIFDAIQQPLSASGKEIFLGHARKRLERLALEQAATGKVDVDHLEDELIRYREYERKLNEDRCDWVSNDLESIAKETTRTGGLEWRLGSLNKAIGPLIRGDFALVGAYVDTGKTAFAVSEITHMASQLSEGSVLWLNNEEHDERVLRKLRKAALNKTWEEILEDVPGAQAEYKELMRGDVDRIKLINIRGYSLNKIKRLFKKYKPKLVVIDQIDKITTPSKTDMKEHTRLGSLYGEMRALCAEYCPVMAICQADASATWYDKDSHEKRYAMYLDQSQLHESKVDKPGEADYIIMIGRDGLHPHIRGIHVAKNKSDDGAAESRHLKTEVYFDGARCRYEDPQ